MPNEHFQASQAAYNALNDLAIKYLQRGAGASKDVATDFANIMSTYTGKPASYFKVMSQRLTGPLAQALLQIDVGAKPLSYGAVLFKAFNEISMNFANPAVYDEFPAKIREHFKDDEEAGRIGIVHNVLGRGKNLEDLTKEFDEEDKKKA